MARKLKESRYDLIGRAASLYNALEKLYPDAHCALNHKGAFQLLIATILSAQCTDERVNMVTPVLFARFPDPGSLSAAELPEIESIIRSTGFFRNKAKSIKGAATLVHEKFADRVPDDMDELLSLPGVARKTANVVLGNAYDINIGVVVDTHVSRLSQRLGLTTQTTPPKIEQDLIKLFPSPSWTMLAHLLIFHGRQVCFARKPRCETCPIAAMCPKIGVEPAKPKSASK